MGPFNLGGIYNAHSNNRGLEHIFWKTLCKHVILVGKPFFGKTKNIFGDKTISKTRFYSFDRNRSQFIALENKTFQEYISVKTYSSEKEIAILRRQLAKQLNSSKTDLLRS